jgi:integrase
MPTIRKRNKKYQVQVRLKNRRDISKTFLTKADAQKWARESERALSLGYDHVNSEVGNFSQLLSQYKERIVPLMRGIKQEYSLCSRVGAYFGSYYPEELSSKTLGSYRDKRLQEVSAQTVKHEVNCVKRVLKIATEEWGLMLPRGVPDVRLPRLPAGRKRRLPEEEQLLLLSALSLEMKDVVNFAIETAMRRSELLKLNCNDISFIDRMCLVSDTKNGQDRAVPLTKAALTIAQRNIGKQGKLFDLKPDSVSQAFRRACKRVEILDLRFHDLRHEAISRLFEKGLSVPQVAMISGHQDFRMLARYVHLHSFNLE